MKVHFSTINSIKDPRVALARELSTPSGRRKHKKIILYGEESIVWAIQRDYLIDYIFCCEKQLPDNICELTTTKEIEVLLISKGISQKISDTSQVYNCIAVAEIKNHGIDFACNSIIILDGLKDHGNIGTIIRTAVAFGNNNIVITNSDYDIFYKNVVISSRGEALNVNFENIEPQSLYQQIKANQYSIIVTSPYAINDISSYILPCNKTAIIFGNETQGISHFFMTHADISVKVSMQNNVDSLNVGVSAGIFLNWLRENRE